MFKKKLNVSLFPVHRYLGKQPQVTSRRAKRKIYNIPYWQSFSILPQGTPLISQFWISIPALVPNCFY